MLKLIRDKYKDIIPKDELIDSSTLDYDSKEKFLYLKLLEEVNEIKDSDFADPNEYADVLEVLEAMANFHNVNLQDILYAKADKRERLGRFNDFLILNTKD
jgi:predicted house-cleaning noncanonical NTP pyrophosphatase (MazG superfamily)